MDKEVKMLLCAVVDLIKAATAWILKHTEKMK